MTSASAPHPTTPRRRPTPPLGSIVLWLLLLFVGGYGAIKGIHYVLADLSQSEELHALYMHSNMPDRFILATHEAYNTQLQYSKLPAIFSARPPQQITTTPRPTHNVVIIMGESLRRQDMHCYGGSLYNTPHIDSLARSGSLVLYDDVVTCAPNTHSSLRKIFTLRSPLGDTLSWYSGTTLPVALAAAGYHTYWASNQAGSRGWVDEISVVASTCQEKRFTKPIKKDRKGQLMKKAVNYDELLLPLLRDYSTFESSDGTTPLFTVVHLMGSHTFFGDRYPSTYRIFSAQDIDEPHTTPEERETSAAYMNSIAYNDRVVSRIIDYYSHTSSIVLYLSDHGLLRYDNPQAPHRVGHAIHPNALQVPFMVYMSPQFTEQNPDIVAAVEMAKHRPFMTDYLSNSLLSLLGIRCEYSTPTRDLWSPHFDSSRPRIIEKWGETVSFTPKHPTQR